MAKVDAANVIAALKRRARYWRRKEMSHLNARAKADRDGGKASAFVYSVKATRSADMAFGIDDAIAIIERLAKPK